MNVIAAAAFAVALGIGILVSPANGAPADALQPALLAQAVPAETPAPLSPDASAPPSNASPPTSAPGSSGPAPAELPPAPAPSGSPPGRFHLHRPGTDVDGDLLTGSLASQAYILKGNVTLRSDPKIDREIADASESEEPLTVTADEIDVDRLGYSYVAKGHVHFVQGTRSGRSNLATLNEQTHSLDMVGDANVYDGDHRTVADRMHYDMLDKSFHGSGDVRIFEPLPTPAPGSGTPAPKHKRRLPL